MRPKLRFKPHAAVTQRSNRAYILAQISDPEQRARYERDHPESNLAPLPVKRTRTPAPQFPGVDSDAIHAKQPLEAEVLRSIADLLAVHPQVAFAVRQNSGMASYEAKSGRYAPVRFYAWIKRPAPMTLPDIWGQLKDGRLLALEVKRSGWTKPYDKRELQQAAFLMLIRSMGGIGEFVTSAEQVEEMLR